MTTVPCKYCGTPTPMTGTRQCDGCHEVASRVRSMPLGILARIITDVRTKPDRIALTLEL